MCSFNRFGPREHLRIFFLLIFFHLQCFDPRFGVSYLSIYIYLTVLGYLYFIIVVYFFANCSCNNLIHYISPIQTVNR